MSTVEVEEVTDNELDGLETENIALLEMPTDAGFVDDVQLQQTDAGAESVHFHSNDDLHAVGSHVILNAVCALLNRPRNPTNFRKKEWRFLQSFVAKCPGESVPLTFPEAALLPSIYYIMAEQSICGAVPAPLFSPSLSKKFNFADIISHIKNRLKDFSLLTSTDPRVIQIYFDCFLNFQAQYCDTRFVLNRGLQEFRSQESEKSEARVRMNEEDSRKVVNELVAAIRSEEPTFFLTFTLNQSRMFGVAPLYRLVEKNVRNLSASKRKNIIEGFMPLYMRLWERAATFFIKYLEKSTEKPLGTIKNIFPRFEFQTSKGNAPHLHVIIWTTESKNDPVIQKKIVGSFRQLLHELQMEMLDPSNNIVQNEKDADELVELARATLSHTCERAGFRCHKKCDNSVNMVCRFKVFDPCFQTFFKAIDRPHSNEVWDLLKSLNLAKLVEGFHAGYEICQELQGGRYNYAADFGETFSPVITKLFTVIQASMNSLLCDRVMSATYLAKYAAGVEEHATVQISGESNDTVSVNVKKMKNIKIAGAQIAAKTDEEKTSSNNNCRILSSTECIWSILDLKYVFPTYVCVHVNTLPLENRGGIVRKKSYVRQVDRPGQHDQALALVKIRQLKQFEDNRLFTKTQEKTLREYHDSRLSIDKVSLFAVRPPELLFIRDIEFYFRHFSFEKISFRSAIDCVKSSLHESCWVDGVGHLIRLRSDSLSNFMTILSENRQDSNPRYSFFASFYEKRFSSRSCVNFLLDERDGFKKPAVVVFPNVIPKHAPNFLINFLLQFGKYETEFDLYNSALLTVAYEKAGLLEDSTNVTQEDLNKLLKKFILRRVVFVPGSHVSQDRQKLEAKAAFSLLMDCPENMDTPTIIYNALRDECSQELQNAINNKFCAVASQLYSLVQDSAKPDIESILNKQASDPLRYNPLCSNDIKFNEEQKVVLESLLRTLDTFVSSAPRFFRFQFVVGMPGSGKTFVIVHALLYALCIGLDVMVTSLSSERAMQFSGVHIHELFGLPVAKRLIVDEIAEKALKKLNCDPIRTTVLRRIDILYFEEIGMVSAEEFAAIDLIMQKVRDNYSPFGGVLVLGTGDPKQLPPPQGRLLWTSPIILTSVTMHALEKCVRMVDVVGREFLNILSSPKITETEMEILMTTFSDECNFCELDNSPMDAVWIFGTRAAESKAIETQIDRVRRSGSKVIEILSCDEVKTNPSSNWKPVAKHYSKVLNKLCLEPEVLYCYQDALLRITINIPSQNVSQGQMCVFKKFDGVKKITVIVALPGVRKLPPCNSNGSYLFEENGWFEITLTKQAGFVHGHKGSSIRRSQFPLKNFMAMTIHKAMGETIGKIVTKIDCVDRAYNLWEKEQLYVLVSRVQNLKDITFLGDKNTTLLSIKNLLGKSSQWDDYTERLVRTASNQDNAVFDMAALSPFRPRKIELPVGEVGFVYLLVSTRDISACYVGEISNLRRRLLEHNSGKGAFFTNQSHLRPWGVMCFATGFSDCPQSNRKERKHLEQKIHDNFFQNFNAFNRQGSPSEVLQIFLSCVSEHKSQVCGLRAVITGTILSRQS